MKAVLSSPNYSTTFKKEVFMLLILEIILTVTAWRKGYGALALLPLAFAIGIGFIVGSANPESVDWLGFIWIDILAIVALIIMIATASKTLEEDVANYESESNNEVSESFQIESEIPKN